MGLMLLFCDLCYSRTAAASSWQKQFAEIRLCIWYITHSFTISNKALKHILQLSQKRNSQ